MPDQDKKYPDKEMSPRDEKEVNEYKLALEQLAQLCKDSGIDNIDTSLKGKTAEEIKKDAERKIEEIKAKLKELSDSKSKNPPKEKGKNPSDSPAPQTSEAVGVVGQNQGQGQAAN